MAKKKVAIIGAGVSGLAAIKCCLDEGLMPVCFERTDNIGGLWNYKNSGESRTTVMKTTVTLLSKELMCYSDFPMPDHYPNFLRQDKFMSYLELYADYFKLKSYIRFATKVVKVQEADDYFKNGKWNIWVESKDGAKAVESFDGVMVCAGVYSIKYMPLFPGQEAFQGKILHSNDVLNPQAFQDQRVLVIGFGNSGADAAVNLGRVTSQTYLSTRTGAWCLKRLGSNGVPFDLTLFTRFVVWLAAHLPSRLVSYAFEKSSNQWFDHKSYGIHSFLKYGQVERVVNDELPNRILCGDVIVHGNIRTLTKHGAIFQDGCQVDNIDVIVMATGYDMHYPFLADDLLPVVDNKMKLYKFCFPPHLEHPTLGFIGVLQPLGPCPSMYEMQCRWFTQVCLVKGKAILPSKKEMLKDIDKKIAEMRTRYMDTIRYTLRVDYKSYTDEIAELVGCKPDLGKMALHDPVLAWKCFFGPLLPSHYRISGPGSWSQARDTILSVWHRVLPINKKGITDMSRDSNRNRAYVIAVAFLVFSCIGMFVLTNLI